MSETKKVPGLTQDNAVLLLAAAEELGLHPSVVTVDHSEGAFVAPSEVVDKADIKEPKKAKGPAKRTARTAKKTAAETATTAQAPSKKVGENVG